MDRQQVLSTDQLRLQVDAFARYRIVDPLRMYISARTEERVSDQLKPILGSALRNELGKRPVRGPAQPRARPDDGRTSRRALNRVAAPIWRRDRRRPDQARRPARRHAARIRLRADAVPRASRRRARSAPRAASRRRSSAPRPTPRPRTPMPRPWQGSGLLRFLPGDAVLRDDLRRQRQREAGPLEHHPVARQRISAGVQGPER